jgi:D-sedoheptulose 7-phosphate isomerase
MLGPQPSGSDVVIRSPTMNRAENDAVAEHFRCSCETLSRAADDPKLLAVIHGIAETITAAFRTGHKLLIAGNGGSAADAQHIAAEFLSRLNFDRNPLPAIALTTDTSVLTAIGNDYGFERIFERQIRGLGKPGDVFIAISTSGRSPNIIAALKAARECGLATIGFTGSRADGLMQVLCDHTLAAPTEETALIQQIHIVAAHAACGLVENSLFSTRK